ncbi:arsenate reductase family protein [Prochlorococcus sp. MIT 1300]|uniref:arsenate reductase family protein n=1 Tax=Prochlorococcus sp. MIT 1300 TaxID=3096218 RepID=UPI0039BF4055
MLTPPVVVYSYSRCSTCRRAIAWLKENGVAHEIVDIVDQPPGKDQLLIAKNQLLNRKKLFNTSGISYRELGASVVNAMSDDEAIEALASDGKLVKRPFLITKDNKVLVGFKQEEWTNLLLN